MLAELERVADHLVLISHGQVRLDGAVEDLLADHRLVSEAQSHRIVRLSATDGTLPLTGESRAVGIEELALSYLRESSAPPLTLAGAGR
jgi:ABC-2 type transport system ATP-binding protein